MKLKNLKLNALSESTLKDKEMNALRGGNCCTCSCYWEYQGGASVDDNTNANYQQDTKSVHGCNQYSNCDGYDNEYWPEAEHA